MQARITVQILVIAGRCFYCILPLALIIANPYKSSSGEKCIPTLIQGIVNINTYFDKVFITF